MVMCYSIICFITSVALIGLSEEIPYYIYCGSCLNDLQKNEESGTCDTKVIYEEYYSDSKKITASKPNWERSCWYIYKDLYSGTRQIALNLTWSQRGDLFSFLEGYQLTVVGNRNNYRKFIVQLKNNVNLSSSDKIIINYPCYGRESNSDVKLKEEYLLILRSIPTYHLDSNPNANEDKNKNFFIDCNEIIQSNPFDFCFNEINDSDYDVINRKYFEEICFDSMYNSYYYGGNDVHQMKEIKIDAAVVAVVLSLSVFAVLSSLLIILYCQKKYRKTKPILLLMGVLDEKDQKYFEAVDILGDILKSYGKLDVVSIVWQLTSSNYTQWIDDSLKANTHIILICTPGGLNNWKNMNLNDPFVIGLNLYVHQMKNKCLICSNSYTFSIVYFDSNPSLCIPVEIIQHKHVNIISHFDSFFFSLTGLKLKQDEQCVKNFRKAVANIQPQIEEKLSLL